MMLGPHTVTVLEPATRAADYGNATTDDWDAPTATVVPGCSVQPVTVPAYTVDRKAITTRWVVWLPLGTPITGRCRVVYAGETYELDGDPSVWDFPPAGHIVANLRRSQG